MALLIEKDPTAAARAVDAIETTFELLEYVALFEIDGPGHVTILAMRHQREEDYH